ncbi:MAG: isoprenylcysteine carboxylmethyltransferase family protein [Candidatus Cybelea sp.]
MTAYFGALSIFLLITMVLARVAMLSRQGVSALKFGATDKTDFLIPPFVFLYLYLIFSNAFYWPRVIRSELFVSTWQSWFGVAVCALALIVMFASLISFGKSFRVGIDTGRPGKLVTSGIFGVTRNPIYVAFAFALFGEFLIQPNWLLLAYLVAGAALMHRQVSREESYLRQQYGAEYETYCARVRRYL